MNWDNAMMTETQYEVKEILQRGRVGDMIYYLVHWDGYSEE